MLVIRKCHGDTLPGHTLWMIETANGEPVILPDRRTVIRAWNGCVKYGKKIKVSQYFATGFTVHMPFGFSTHQRQMFVREVAKECQLGELTHIDDLF